MDYLFGQIYPHNINRDIDDDDLPEIDDWYVSWDMLTPNKKSEPTYTTTSKREEQLKNWEKFNENNEWFPYRFKTEKEFISTVKENQLIFSQLDEFNILIFKNGKK